MELVPSKALLFVLIFVSYSANATVLVTNDGVDSSVRVDICNYPENNVVLATSGHQYSGAAGDFSNSVSLDTSIGTYGGTAEDKFAVGTGYLGGLQTNLFSGHILTDDSAAMHNEKGTASAVLQTYWEFTTSEAIEYALHMVGEFGGAISYSLFDMTNGLVVSEDSAAGGTTSFSLHGNLDANISYSLSMSLVRDDDILQYGVGDGYSLFCFAIDDDYLMSSGRTHRSVPEPSGIYLFFLGLAFLTISRALRET